MILDSKNFCCFAVQKTLSFWPFNISNRWRRYWTHYDLLYRHLINYSVIIVNVFFNKTLASASAGSSAHSTALLDRVANWWKGNELLLLSTDPILKRLMGYDDIPKEIQQWENPWIRDQGSHMLPRTKHNRIVNCTLDQLHILRTGPAEFVLRVPVPQSQRVPHSDAKLRRWATSLILLCPDLPIGKVLASATSAATTRFETLQLGASRRRDHQKSLDGNREWTTLASHYGSCWKQDTLILARNRAGAQWSFCNGVSLLHNIVTYKKSIRILL